MKEKLDGAVYRCEHWSHAPRGTEYTFRWSAFAQGDGVGENLQLLSACLKDGLGWQKVPRGTALFKNLEDGLRSFCAINGLEMLQEACNAQENGAVYDLESPSNPGDGWAEIAQEKSSKASRIRQMHYYSGYMFSSHYGHFNERIQVEFAVSGPPDGSEPSHQEQDAAFMAALAQKMQISADVVHSNGVKTDYDGFVESDSGCIQVRFSCAADASVAEMDAAHLAAMAQQVQFNWVCLGTKIVTPVAVVGHNANGEPDVFMTEVVCSQEQFDNGEHYDLAKEQAVAEDFDPSIAFDPNDEAWRSPLWRELNASADHDNPVVILDVGGDGITCVRSNVQAQVVILDGTWGDSDIESVVDGESFHITKPDVMVLDADRFAHLMGQINDPQPADDGEGPSLSDGNP